MALECDRRRFVKTVAVGMCGAFLGPARATDIRLWQFFTFPEARVVDAISEQIIPADQDPGARDAGVVFFIDKQLMGPYRRHQQTYRDGLAGVAESCQAMYKKDFLELSADQQTELLQSLESGKVKGELWKKCSPSGFFNLIREHTIQGFYGGPQHGGNRGYVSYKMMGIDYPQIIGQNRYGKK